MKNFALLLIMLMLSGCAGSGTMTTKTTMPDGSIAETSQPGSFMGPSSYDIGYTQMFIAHEQGKATRASAIMGVKTPDNPEAKAYAEAAKLMGVALISMERFDIKAPITGFDVLYKLTDSVVPVAGFVSLYKLGVSGLENAGSITQGDNATNTGAFNRTNTTAVSTGSSSLTNTVQPYQVNQPEPITILPEGFTKQ